MRVVPQPLPCPPLFAALLALAAACGDPQQVPGPGPTAPATGVPEPVPALVCDEPRVDLGTVFAGARLVHRFALSSVGDADALVVRIKPGCACSVAAAWTEGPDGARIPYAEYDHLPPGRTLFVEAEVDTTGRRGPQDVDISLYANVPENVVRLSISVQVDPWLVLDPGQVLLGRRLAGEATVAQARVRGPVGERFALRCAADPLPAALRVTCVPDAPDADGRAEAWTVRVEHGPGGQPGSLRAWIPLASDRPHPAARALGSEGGSDPVHGVRLMAVGDVLSPVAASLEQLAFGRLRAGVLVSRTVRVESHDPDFEFADEPFARLLGPEGGAFVHADSFSLVTRPVEDARAWDLELTTEGLPAREEGAFRGILVVEVGHDEVFEVEVPFSGVQF